MRGSAEGVGASGLDAYDASLDGPGVDSDESEPLLSEGGESTQLCGCLSPKYALGLAMLGGVVVIWVAASALVQYIYQELHWDGPFFLTFTCTTLFAVYLPMVACSAALRRRSESSHHALRDDEDAEKSAGAAGQQLSFARTARAALIICPMWFIANFSYNASLAHTSVTVNTILSTASSLFTFLLSVLVLRERATWPKVAGVVVAMAGASIVGLVSTSDDTGTNTLAGDALCLFAGFMYGAYCVAMRRILPDDDKVSMPLFFGLLGSFNFCIFGGLVIAFHFTGVEPLTALSGRAFGLIVVKGLVDNVISDYLWARAVLLTSPTVSTVGLSLTVPLAMLSDLLIHGSLPSPLSALGAVLVIAGFIGVNTGNTAPAVTVCDVRICGDADGAAGSNDKGEGGPLSAAPADHGHSLNA